nr:MAG TPA: hypothetical protein [Caudoviricetes sp.]
MEACESALFFIIIFDYYFCIFGIDLWRFFHHKALS